MSGVKSADGLAIIAGLIVGERGPLDFDDAVVMADIGTVRDSIVLPALNSTRSRLLEADDVDILIESPSIAEAVACALAIQTEMVGRNVAIPRDARLHFRFGIDLAPDGTAAGSRASAIAGCSGSDEIWFDAAVTPLVQGGARTPVIDCGARPIGPAGDLLALARIAPERPRESSYPPQPQPRAQPRVEVSEGLVLNGTYRIENLIAQGGMGEVFRGHEIHSGGTVAVKLLRSDMSTNKVALGLFQREAQILKEIYHDAIVRYFLFSFDQAVQRHYLAMEFVDGIPLAELIKKQPLSFEDVSVLRQRVASALFVAHERGIIHRDMSPDNILLPGGLVARAKVIDFGIARAAEIGGGTLIGGGFAGKYNYVSPEQLGLAGGEITPESDIYSLGLVLAECSLGVALNMDGTQAEVIEKRRVVPDLSRLDERLRPLIEQMLQPDPAKRPPSMAAIANWSGPVSGPGIGPGPGSIPPVRRRFTWVYALAGCAVAALVVGIGGIAFRHKLVEDRRIDSTQTPHDASPVRVILGPPPGELPIKTEVAPAGTLTPSSPPATPSVPATVSPPATTTTASLPPASPPPAVSGPDAMTAFAQSFAPSDCFMAKPIQMTPTSALVEAFASSRDDFSTFDHDFSQKFGFSPDVAAYRVWSKQCPALAFARHVTPGPKSPFLLLKSVRVGSGQPISGVVGNAGDAMLTLLLVHEDGTVSNVTESLKRAGDGLTFDLPNDARTAPVPQLLMVLASGQPFKAIGDTGTTAATLFPALQREIGADPGSVRIDTKLFLLGG